MFWHLYQIHTFNNNPNDDILQCELHCKRAFFNDKNIIKLFEIFYLSYYFAQLNLVFIADSHTGFCSGLHWKHQLNLRSSYWSCSVTKTVFKNFSNFTGKHVSRSSRPWVPVKKVFLNISQNSQENTSPRVSFLIKLWA